MKQGIMRLVRGRDLIPADLLHENEKQSIEVRGDFLPQRQCDKHPWCAQVRLVVEEDAGRIDSVVAIQEVALLVLQGPGGPTIYGEVGHMEPVHTLQAASDDEYGKKKEKTYICFGIGGLIEVGGEVPIETIDDFVDEAADRRYGRRS